MNLIWDKKTIVGYGIQKYIGMLSINSEYSVRDLITHPEIGISSIPGLAKKFYDIDLDVYFRSTVRNIFLYI